MAQSAGEAEYTDYNYEESLDSANEFPGYDNLMVRFQ